MKRIILFWLILIFLGSCWVSNFAWADIFNVYNDNGIPHRSQLWTWHGGGGSFQVIPDQEAPERVSYYKTISQNWAGWGIVFNYTGADYTMDLSEYQQGSLKFFVKTPVNLKVELQETSRYGPKRTKYITNYGWNGLDEWQEITIPISDFSANLTQIFSPFMITAEASANFYVDYVRWELPISGYTPTSVKIDGRKLLVNNQEFTVKGVAAEFTPIGELGSVYDWSLVPASYTPDIPLISEMKANVIRTYLPYPTQREALDSLYGGGIYVIMGFPVDAVYGPTEQAVDFGNSVVRQNIKSRFLEMIGHWRNHPAILMWCFGNEVNRILEDKGVNPSNWYSLVNECAQVAHQLEGANYHPVTTANFDQVVWDIGNPTKNANDASLPNLDLWSLQMYRGRTFANAFVDYKNLTSKPLLISEFGCDAYDGRIGEEDQPMQADYLTSQWSEISQNLSSLNSTGVCVGGVVFSWRDGWYKSSYGTIFSHDTQTDWLNYGYDDPNINEEWWGIMSIEQNPIPYSPDIMTPRQVYYSLQSRFECGENGIGKYYAGPDNGKSCDGTEACCNSSTMKARNGYCTFSCSGGGCFLAGTSIFMADGSLKLIEEIKVGDLVKSVDQQDKIVANKVTKLFVHPQTHGYLLVETSDGKKLQVTPEHRVKSEDAYKPIGSLTINSPLALIKDGKLIETKITAMRKIETTQTVYNFEVENTHTYFADNYLVHNRKRIPYMETAE